MFTIKNNNCNLTNLDYNNCVYSNKESRPSKSIVDCNLYKEFIKIDLSLDILNEYSYLKLQSKTTEYFLLRETINLLNLDTEYNDNLSLCFDSIIFNEVKNLNIVYCLEKKLTIKSIFENIIILIEELQLNDILIMNYTDLYIYPSAELLIILSNLFSKIKIYYSHLLKSNIILCYSYKSSPKITVFLKNILKNWTKSAYIRQFGIFINSNLQNMIKKHNSEIFNYYINLNDNIIVNYGSNIMEEKEYFFKNYMKKYHIIKNNINPFKCSHIIKELDIFNCFICTKCYEFFHIY